MNLSTSPRFTARLVLRRAAPLGVLALFAGLSASAVAEPAGTVATATATRTAAAAAAAVVVSAPLAPSARAGEHPAVLQWRRAQAGLAPLDANHFLVQPPATARWTDGSDDTPAPVYARR